MIGDGWCSPGLSGLALDAITWVILDTETSGLDPAADELRELAALVVDQRGRRLDTVTWHAADGAVPVTDAIARLVECLDAGAMLVAHNVAFDLAFLERVAGWRDPPAWLCTMRLCGRRVSLDALAARLDIGVEGRHTAIGDATTLARVLAALSARARARNLATVSGLAVVCPLVAVDGKRSPQSLGSWDGVRAALDLVTPIPFVGREVRQAFRAMVDSSLVHESGPATPHEHERVVAALTAAGVSALTLDVLLEQVHTEIPAKSENRLSDT